MNCVLDVRDGTHDSPKYYNEGIPFVTSKNLKNGTIDFSTCKLISKEDSLKYNERSRVDDYDILFAMIGTIGNPTIVKKDRDFSIKNVALFKNISRDLLSENWVKCVLECVTSKMKSDAQGGLQPFVSLDFLRNYIMPLPPISEQKRILSTINKMNICVQNINSDFNSLITYVNFAKRKILDGVFGENSSYKSYYGKRTKTTLSKLIPQDKIGDGDWVLSENMDENGEYALLQLKHIGQGTYLNKSFCHVNNNFFQSNNCTEIRENFILINRLIADNMNVCILPNLGFKCITAVDVCWIAPSIEYNQKYLLYYLLSPSFQKKVQLKTSGTTRKRISKKNLISLELNIHDIEYQESIALEIEKMFKILDSIVS